MRATDRGGVLHDAACAITSACTGRGVLSGPLIGVTSIGQAENPTTTSINARSTTLSPGRLTGGSMSTCPLALTGIFIQRLIGYGTKLASNPAANRACKKLSRHVRCPGAQP